MAAFTNLTQRWLPRLLVFCVGLSCLPGAQAGSVSLAEDFPGAITQGQAQARAKGSDNRWLEDKRAKSTITCGCTGPRPVTRPRCLPNRPCTRAS